MTATDPVEDEFPNEDAPDQPGDRPDLFLDVEAFLNGGLPKPPPRVVGFRDDGQALFYAGQVNYIFGDPESGKTFLALAGAAEALRAGRRVAVIDMDHNGPGATLTRLLALGAPRDALQDRTRFRYVEPEDEANLKSIVTALVEWRAAVAVVDSVGELLPLLGLSSNQPDDYTIANAKVLKPLATAGAAVVAIDHLAKNTESRASGPTGTNAKRRAVGGVSLRVVATQAFTPGRGGRALLTINKDRHGGLRAACPPPDKGEAIAGTFVLHEDELGRTTWRITTPDGTTTQQQGETTDVQILLTLDPVPTTVREVKERMHWGTARASAAFKAFCASSCSSPTTYRVGNEEHDVPPSQSHIDEDNESVVPQAEEHEQRVPRSPHIGEERGTSTCAACFGPMVVLGDGATTHPGCEVAA